MMKSNLSVLSRLKPIQLGRSKIPDGPKVLQRVIDELAPSLRKHTTILKEIKRFIFQEEDSPTAKKQKSSWTSCKLRMEIEKTLPEKERTNLDLLLTTLEGMQLAVQQYDLHSDKLVDGFAQEQKRVFKHRLFGASNPCRK